MPRKAAAPVPTRLEFPKELSVHEQHSWATLMKHAPAGHFLPVDVPAIVSYCRLTTIAQRLYPKVRDGQATKEERAEYLAVQSQVTQLCRLLRLGPSTRNAQRDRAGRNARDHGDAFNPDSAPDWRQVMGSGRA